MKELPIPATSEEFEWLVKACVEASLGKTPKKMGRRGQTQYGMDFIIGTKECTIGIQCKKRSFNSPLQLSEIIKDLNAFNDWVSKENSFYTCFWLYTTLRSDSKLQLKIAELMSANLYPFEISLYFWDDIEAIILEHPHLIKTFYSSFVFDNSDIKDYTNRKVIDDFPDITPTIQRLSNKLRNVYSLNKNAVFIDHGTLLFISQILDEDYNELGLSKYHLAAFDQFVEAIVLNENIYVVDEIQKHKWESLSGIDSISNVIKEIMIPPLLSEAIGKSEYEWINNFWQSRSSRGLLARMIHAQLSMMIERKGINSILSDKSDSLMLRHETNKHLISLCYDVWEQFLNESSKGSHRNIKNIGMLPHENWISLLHKLENHALNLIYWMFHRTFHYQTICLSLGGPAYYAHPLRATTLSFEASGRNKAISKFALSIVYETHNIYAKWIDNKNIPIVNSVSCPPVSHFLLNITGGQIVEAIYEALRLRNTDEARALRDCFCEIEYCMKYNPIKLNHRINEFEKAASNIAKKWNINKKNRFFFSVTKINALIENITNRFGVKLGPKYLSLFKSLVDSVRYCTYNYPHLSAETENNIYSSDLKPFKNDFLKAEKVKPFTKRKKSKDKANASMSNRKRQGGVQSRSNKKISKGPSDYKLSYGKINSRKRNNAIKSVINTFGGWGS